MIAKQELNAVDNVIDFYIEYQTRDLDRALKIARSATIKNVERPESKLITCKRHGQVDGVISNNLTYCTKCMQESIDKEKKQKEIEQKMLRRDALHVPPLFTDKTLDNFKILSDNHALALTASKSFIANPSNKRLILSGDVGLGKTHLLWSIAKEFYKNYGWVYAKTWAEAKLDCFGDFEKQAKFIDTLAKVDLIAIDDFGAKSLTHGEQDAFLSIINCAHNYKIPVLITTNIDIDVLKNEIRRRAFSRLAENAKFFTLRGQSQRNHDDW